ncbi:MAG: outer membrane beta-barrel protein [Gallionella sp.]|jgi:OOP family OmpA-OmpF porin|nr:outer membrane beta-barrel protein [Gallionella sp.]
MTIKQGLIAAAILVCVSNTAFARDNGGYAGVGFGSTWTNVQNTTTGVTTNYSSSGAHIFGGYQLNQNFAVEAEYVDLGKFSGTTVAVAGTGLGVSAVGILPVSDKFSLYGKLGIASVNSTLTAAPGYVLLVPASESKVGVSFGAGAELAIAPQAAIRLSLDSYAYSAGTGQLTGNVGVVGIAGIFKF